MVDQHPVILRGLDIEGFKQPAANRPPTLIERTDQALIDALLAELEDDQRPLTAYQAQRPDAGAGGDLQLFQPVHRTFNLVLFEVACDRFGEPRLDPQEIEGAGLVVRRYDRTGRLESWATAGQRIRGWIPVADNPQLTVDPDPAFRPLALNAGLPALNRLLALQQGAPTDPVSEQVAPLYVAPPEVCQARGKTILYGLVPVTSSEFSEAPLVPDLTPGEQNTFKSTFRGHLSRYLKIISAFDMPRAGQVLNHEMAKTLTPTGWLEFLTMLRQVAIELAAFGENPALRSLLNTVSVTYLSGATEPAGDFLERAANIFVRLDGAEEEDAADKPVITMPARWPTISDDLADSIFANALARVESKAAELDTGQPRFGRAGATYALQGFVRVRQPDGCPPVTTWSPLSAPFTIAPWFEPKEGVPPVQVPLPDISDREKLKKMKPNVAFQVPQSLFALLAENTPEDFLEGKAGEKVGIALDWICGFNIPIITLCAFIVLNIFLSLFDLIFRWLMFIKVCIPVPKRT